MQTIRITDDRAPDVEAVVTVDRGVGGLPRVESVTFVAANGAGVRPPDLQLFDVAGLLGAAAAVQGAAAQPLDAEAFSVDRVRRGRPAVKKAGSAKKASAKKALVKKAGAKKAPVKKAAAPGGKASAKTAPVKKVAGKRAASVKAAKAVVRAVSTTAPEPAPAAPAGAPPVGSGGSDRPYRRRPDDFAAKHAELDGSTQALMAHYGAARHQITGWRTTARNQGLLPPAEPAQV